MALGAAASSIIKGGKSLASFAKNKVGIETIMGTVEFTTGMNRRMKEGDSFFSSVAKEGLQFAAFQVAPMTSIALTMAPAMVEMTKGAYRFRRQRHEQYVQGLENAANNVVGGEFMDTEQAATMRQAAIQQIQGNKLNARSALGGEARIFAGNQGYLR